MGLVICVPMDSRDVAPDHPTVVYPMQPQEHRLHVLPPLSLTLPASLSLSVPPSLPCSLWLSLQLSLSLLSLSSLFLSCSLHPLSLARSDPLSLCLSLSLSLSTNFLSPSLARSASRRSFCPPDCQRAQRGSRHPARGRGGRSAYLSSP